MDVNLCGRDFLFGITDDRGPEQVVLLVIRLQPDAHQVACGVGTAGLSGIFGGQSFSHQLLVEAFEGRMLNDGEHVQIGFGLLPFHQHQATVFFFLFPVLRFTPHQAQAAANGLLQQDGCLGRTQGDDDADVVYIEAFA